MDPLPPDTLGTSGNHKDKPFLHDDSNEIDPDLNATRGTSGYSDKRTCKNETDIETIVEILVSAWLQFPPRRPNIFEDEDSAILCPEALHAMSTVWKQIRTEKKDLLESKVIVQGVARSIISHMYRLELMVYYGEKQTKKKFTKRVENILTKCWQQLLDEIEEDEQVRAVKMRERQEIVRERLGRQMEMTNVNLHYESIVERLFSAWLKFPPRRPNVFKDKDSAFLSPKALQAISSTWKQIKAETKDLPDSEVIVQGLVKSMVNYMYRLEPTNPDDEEKIKAFTGYIENIVAKCWQQLLNESEEEDERERSMNMRERRQRILERLRRQREITYVNWFYEPFAKKDHERSRNCRRFCILLCLCSSKFKIQVLIHTILLAWAISIGTMGGMYMKLCPMSCLMPYMMIAIGFAGTLAILTRLSFAMFENIFRTEITVWWPTILVKFLEFMLFIFIIIHMYCFYSKTPSYNHGSPDYCNETFYEFVYWITYVTIVVSSMWLIVYLIKGVLMWNLRRFTL